VRRRLLSGGTVETLTIGEALPHAIAVLGDAAYFFASSSSSSLALRKVSVSGGQPRDLLASVRAPERGALAISGTLLYYSQSVCCPPGTAVCCSGSLNVLNLASGATSAVALESTGAIREIRIGPHGIV